MKKRNTTLKYQQQDSNQTIRRSAFRKGTPLVGFFFVMVVQLLGNSWKLTGQETWNLSKCIQYATEHNIELNRQMLAEKNQQVNLMESKAGLLPGINMGTSAAMSFGRSVDPQDNSITFNQTLGNSYWLEASVYLFKGLVNINSVAFNHYLLLASREETKISENKLVVDVLSAYYTVVYSEGLASVANDQVNLSLQQMERMQKLVEVGKESPVTVQELKSQWANDKMAQTRAENNLTTALLLLKQLLQIDATLPFQVDTLMAEAMLIGQIPGVDSVYNQALVHLPDVKQEDYLLQATEKNLAMAKGELSPRIYLSAGYYTGYYDANSSVQATDPFHNQINNNQSQQLNLGLTIPIFNQASGYAKIKRRQIAVNDQRLVVEKKKEELYSQIWSATEELKSSEREYQAANELLEYSKLTLEQLTKKLENGLASTTDFDVAKQRYMGAKASLLKSKLIFLMRSQMLEFYLTGNWSHIK